MKQTFCKFINGLMPVMIILFAFLSVKAQARFAPVNDAKIQYTIENVVVVNDKVLEFDLYLKTLDNEKPFELSIIQAGVLVNSEIVNGGDITTTIVPESSELNATQQPTIAIWDKGPVNCIIKITPKMGPGPGNGTIIKSTGQGTKICRVRITNSVPFAKAKPNLSFSFTSVPYPTKVFQYVGKVSTQLMTNSANCFSKAENPVLNK